MIYLADYNILITDKENSDLLDKHCFTTCSNFTLTGCTNHRYYRTFRLGGFTVSIPFNLYDQCQKTEFYNPK